MNNSPDMNTGELAKITMVADAKAGTQKTVMVDPQDMMTQSSSGSRGGRMDIKPGAVNPIKPSNRDTYQ